MITLENGHGRFQARPIAVDAAIDKHLPASLTDLRRELAEVNGYGREYPEHYADVFTVSEAIVMLADYIQGSWDNAYYS